LEDETGPEGWKIGETSLPNGCKPEVFFQKERNKR
jgi:hypothetical protein